MESANGIIMTTNLIYLLPPLSLSLKRNYKKKIHTLSSLNNCLNYGGMRVSVCESSVCVCVLVVSQL